MFILRQLNHNNEKSEENIEIGNFYNLKRKTECLESFNREYKIFSGSSTPLEKVGSSSNPDSQHMYDKTYAMLKTANGRLIPLHAENTYYIMSESGKTFDSFKRSGFNSSLVKAKPSDDPNAIECTVRNVIEPKISAAPSFVEAAKEAATAYANEVLEPTDNEAPNARKSIINDFLNGVAYSLQNN